MGPRKTLPVTPSVRGFWRVSLYRSCSGGWRCERKHVMAKPCSEDMTFYAFLVSYVSSTLYSKMVSELPLGWQKIQPLLPARCPFVESLQSCLHTANLIWCFYLDVSSLTEAGHDVWFHSQADHWWTCWQWLLSSWLGIWLRDMTLLQISTTWQRFSDGMCDYCTGET